MNFEIDPCKAVMTKMAFCNDDINTMNDLCYEISSAYGNVYGPDVEKKLNTRCVEMIADKKKELGYTDCYMKRPSPPPIFNQVPHFFPSLLYEMKDPDKAYKKCCEMADRSRYPNTSLEYCRLDADAVVGSVESYDRESSNRESSEEIDYEKYADKHPFAFFLGYMIVIFIILFLVYIFVYKLYK